MSRAANQPVVSHSATRTLLAALITATTIAMVVFSAMPSAGAHTSFVESTPADGAVVDAPVSEITLTFSGDAEPVGDGFMVREPEGSIRMPDSVSSPDNLTWTLAFEPPLTGGVVGLRWQVAAPDAHPIDGIVTFTVAAPSTEQSTADPSADSSPPEPSTTISSPDTDVASGDTASGSVALGTPTEVTDAAPDDEAAAVANDEAVAADESSLASASNDGESMTMEEFLASDMATASGVDSVATLARAATMVAATLAVGGLLFAALTLRGAVSDIRAVLIWVRRAAALLVMASILEAVSLIVSLEGSWTGLASPSAVIDSLLSSTGLAIALRAIGASLLANGATLHTLAAHEAPDPVARVEQLAAVGAGSVGVGNHVIAMHQPGTPPRAEDRAWNPQAGIAAFIGAAAVLLSFSFDGHTAAEGPRLLHGLANIAHVGAAATWAGGVAMLAFLTARHRRRTGGPRQSLHLAIRFSVVATIALVVAGLAGTALTMITLHSISDLWSTPWGRLLLLKVGLVAAAAACGGYNHRVLIPELERTPATDPLRPTFRRVVTLEAVLLVLVAIVTAVLVASSAT